MRVRELIDILSDQDPDAEVELSIVADLVRQNRCKFRFGLCGEQQAGVRMALVVGLVEQRLRDPVDAVLEHALALERERAEREPAVEVLVRLQLVDALVGEELGRGVSSHQHSWANEPAFTAIVGTTGSNSDGAFCMSSVDRTGQWLLATSFGGHVNATQKIDREGRLASSQAQVFKSGGVNPHSIVNIFGRGIVATSDDFGTRGDPPSHPELLDWLAGEFMEPSDWGATSAPVLRTGAKRQVL